MSCLNIEIERERILNKGYQREMNLVECMQLMQHFLKHFKMDKKWSKWYKTVGVSGPKGIIHLAPEEEIEIYFLKKRRICSTSVAWYGHRWGSPVVRTGMLLTDVDRCRQM